MARLARGRGHGDGLRGVGHGLARHHEVAAVDLESQRFLVEIGLLHQPVRHASQQVEMRPAAFIAARPQPDVVRQQERDAALALPRQQQQRLAVRAFH